MDEPYKNREIDEFKREMFARLDIQDKTLTRIETQTIKTNGRVNGIEDWSTSTKAILEKILNDNAKLKTDRTRIYTLIAVLTFMTGGIGFLFYNLIDLKFQAQQAQQTALLPNAVTDGINNYYATHVSKIELINHK